MKYSVIILFCFFLINGNTQDSITVTLQGKSIEFIKQEPIINTRLETSFFIKNSSFKKDIITDQKGEFVYKLRIPKETPSVSLDLNAIKSGYSNHFIYTFSCGSSDTTIQLYMQLKREKTCVDSWLPATIYFSKNDCDSTEDSFTDLINFISFYKENKSLLKGKKIKVTAYNSFTEKTKVAKCRANYIHSTLLEYGLSESDFIIETAGKNSLTHYYYTNGCHTEKEFEEKIDLSKSSYKKASAEQKKEMEILRRSVRFEWK